MGAMPGSDPRESRLQLHVLLTPWDGEGLTALDVLAEDDIPALLMFKPLRARKTEAIVN